MTDPVGQKAPQDVDSETELFSDAFLDFVDEPVVMDYLKRSQAVAKFNHAYLNRPGPYSDLRAPAPSGVLDTPVVDIVLVSGARETHYAIHKGLLQFESSYFRTALAKEWHDSSTPLKLTYDTDTFEVFRDFLYFGGTHSVVTTSTATNKDVRLMVKAWIFAHEHLAPAFENYSINQILTIFTGPSTAKTDGACPYEHFEYITEHTAPTSNIRRLFIDIAAAICKPIDYSRLNNVSDPMFAQLLQLLLQKTNYVELKVLWIRLSHPCFYHHHDDGDRCTNHFYDMYVPLDWRIEDILPRVHTSPGAFEQHPDIQRLATLYPHIDHETYGLPRWTVVPGLAPAGQVFDLLVNHPTTIRLGHIYSYHDRTEVTEW